MEPPPKSADPRPPVAPTKPFRGPAGLYAASVLAIAVALVAEFLIACELLAQSPLSRPGLARQANLALDAGLLVLAAQVVLVAILLRRLKRSAAEIAGLTATLDRERLRDKLTKALNRMAFDHMIGREMENFRRFGLQLCGVMLDVDSFRSVNERLGYAVGDQILAELAELLKRSIRSIDFLFRWRSGRFLVLAAGIDPDEAERLAATLRAAVAGHAFRHSVTLTVTQGLTHATAEDTPETFVARIKSALALAKDKGPGHIVALRPPAPAKN